MLEMKNAVGLFSMISKDRMGDRGCRLRSMDTDEAGCSHGKTSHFFDVNDRNRINKITWMLMDLKITERSKHE